MTVHVPRLPFSFDPLIGEAKRRARRRRLLLIAVVVVFAAAGAAFALRPTGGPGVSLPQRPTALPHRAITVGSHGPVVAAWQRLLNEWLGGSWSDRWARAARERVARHIEVNGTFDKTTEAATLYWQRDAYEKPTGVVTLKSWAIWMGANVTCCGAGFPDFTARELHAFGLRPVGPVAWWQSALNRWRARHQLSPVFPDGVYSAQTRAATQTFQRSVGLPATGVADAATWSKAQHLNILSIG